MARFVAGACALSQFEIRITEVIDEVKSSEGDVILFIDELHTFTGAGAGVSTSLDACNILKPALARGVLMVSHAIFV